MVMIEIPGAFMTIKKFTAVMVVSERLWSIHDLIEKISKRKIP